MRHQLTVSDYCSDWFLKEKGVHPGSQSGIRTREEVIASYKGLKVDYIEVNHSYWDDVPGDKIKQLCLAAGFPIYSYNFFLNLALPDAERKTAIAECQQLLKKTADMGARHAMIVPALINAERDLEMQREWVIEGLRDCAKIAESLNLILISENCDYPPIRPLMGSGNGCALICKGVDSPAFKLIYDCCAPLFVEEDTLRTLHAMLPFMEHVHLKNSRLIRPEEKPNRYLDSDGGLRYTGSLLTDGAIHIQPVLNELQRVGYNRTISIEYQGMDDPVPALATNIEYVRRLEDSV